MNNKEYFINWLDEYWNKLIDIVPSFKYEEVRDIYLKEINNEHWIKQLSQHDGLFDVEFNAIMYLVEKWLYRQSKVYESDKSYLYRDNSNGRTALIYEHLYDRDSGIFYDYDIKKQERIKTYNPTNQFFMYWLYFSYDKKLALSLVKEIKESNYVIFMGLRRLGLFKEANKTGKEIGYQIDDYNPNISTTNAGIIRYYSREESLSLIKQAGFDTFDLAMMQVDEFFASDDYLENAKKLKEYVDKLGLKCNQTHSIFPVYHKTINQEETNRRILYTKRILEISELLGAKNCVIHPINDFNEEANYKFYQEFLPLADELDINIATENMWNWEDGKASLAACSNHDNYKKLLDMVNDKHFVACVDVGHAEMDGLETSASKMIETLNQYVKCLHIHDNNLKNDRHNMALFEYIDFDLILDSLARINYQGDITFECDGFYYRLPKELHLSGLKLMHKIGMYLKGELLIRRKAICLKK